MWKSIREGAEKFFGEVAKKFFGQVVYNVGRVTVLVSGMILGVGLLL